MSTDLRALSPAPLLRAAPPASCAGGVGFAQGVRADQMDARAARADGSLASPPAAW